MVSIHEIVTVDVEGGMLSAGGGSGAANSGISNIVDRIQESVNHHLEPYIQLCGPSARWPEHSHDLDIEWQGQSQDTASRPGFSATGNWSPGLHPNLELDY